MTEPTIRPIRRDDRDRILSAFRSLDRRSVYLRFFSYKNELSEEELRRVTEGDGVNRVALVATVGTADQEAVVGLGEYVRTGTAADIAFVIQHDFQGRGIATRLLRQLADIARDNGILQLQADVLAGNAPMLNVLRNSGLPIRETLSERVIHVTIPLA